MEWTQRGFIIVLTEEDAVVLFGTSICISHLASADQINRKPRLICNSSEDPDNVTPSVSVFIDKALAPKAMQFGVCLFRLLLKIW